MPEVHHYPVTVQRHTWCVDDEHLHYQASYQHQIIHGFSATFTKAYRCFGRSRGRRLTVLEVRHDPELFASVCSGFRRRIMPVKLLRLDDYLSVDSVIRF